MCVLIISDCIVSILLPHPVLCPGFAKLMWTLPTMFLTVPPSLCGREPCSGSREAWPGAENTWPPLGLQLTHSMALSSLVSPSGKWLLCAPLEHRHVERTHTTWAKAKSHQGANPHSNAPSNTPAGRESQPLVPWSFTATVRPPLHSCPRPAVAVLCEKGTFRAPC